QPTSDDELGQLVAAFEEMRQALRKALETAWQLADDQKQVNAAFAHDLRTPLTVLQGNLELLTLTEEGQPPDQHLLDEMQRQLDRMNNFIKTMSHVTSIQNIRLNHHAITEAQVEQQLRSEVDKLPTAK
ncbi:HAMP domain-containing protein, partial [Acinetobacter baumannii]